MHLSPCSTGLAGSKRAILRVSHKYQPRASQAPSQGLHQDPEKLPRSIATKVKGFLIKIPFRHFLTTHVF